MSRFQHLLGVRTRRLHFRNDLNLCSFRDVALIGPRRSIVAGSRYQALLV
jgi:hypothetical protein